MKYDRRRMAAAVILLTVLATLCTGCGGNAAAPETRTRELRAAEPQALGLLLSGCGQAGEPAAASAFLLDTAVSVRIYEGGGRDTAQAALDLCASLAVVVLTLSAAASFLLF